MGIFYVLRVFIEMNAIHLRSFLEVFHKQLQCMCMHVGGTNGGIKSYSLRRIHIGRGGAVILTIHYFHGRLNPAIFDDATVLEIVNEITVLKI